jgi:hypothetical protein
VSEIIAAILAIGFLCLVMTIPLTIGLLLLIPFLKLVQFTCFGLAKLIECVALRGADKPGAGIEALRLVKRGRG